MSNPTELPDLAEAVRKLVKAKGRFHTEQNYKELADALARYDARRAQPEGEAPQAGIVAWYRDEQVDANEDTITMKPRYFTHRALSKGAGRPPGEGWRPLYDQPAATLSPLCGAQHADEAAAARAWADENVSSDAYDPAVEAFGAGASWRGAQHAESGKEADAAEKAAAYDELNRIAELHGFASAAAAIAAARRAAQQAAAPGPLELRTCCDHPDCTTCAGRGGFYRMTAPSAPGTPEAPKQPAHGHRDDYYLLANGRRLGLEPISRVRNMPNWVLAMQLFSTGSTSARQLCRDAGVHPDSTITHRAAAPKGGV